MLVGKFPHLVARGKAGGFQGKRGKEPGVVPVRPRGIGLLGRLFEGVSPSRKGVSNFGLLSISGGARPKILFWGTISHFKGNGQNQVSWVLAKTHLASGDPGKVPVHSRARERGVIGGSGKFVGGRTQSLH